MKEQEVNRAVAECMGWTEVTQASADNVEGNPPIGHPLHGYGHEQTPRYFSDLNACADMRHSLNVDEQRMFSAMVAGAVAPLTSSVQADYVFAQIDADAPTQCKCYLMVKGKWIEPANNKS